MNTIMGLITTLLTVYANDFATGNAKAPAQKVLTDWMALVAIAAIV